MNAKLSAALLTAIVSLASPVWASLINYDFSNPSGVLGNTQIYTQDGIDITARGYSGISMPKAVGTPTALYGKNFGGDENGVGIAAGRDFEIVGNYFIQLDFTDVKAKMNVNSAQILINSVQEDESYNIYGSKTVGVPGTLLLSGGTLNNTLFSIPSFNQYSYFSVSAAAGNVLIGAVTLEGTAVPEPGTFALAGCALMIVVELFRRSRSRATV